MHLRIFALTTLIILCTSVDVSAAAESHCPEGAKSEPRTVVHMTPGPNWANAENFQEDHLKFVASHLASGELLWAGAMLTDSVPNGKALMIFKNTDVHKIREIVIQDPLIKEKVYDFSLSSWPACSKGKLKAINKTSKKN